MKHVLVTPLLISFGSSSNIITLFRSITVFYGTHKISWNISSIQIECGNYWLKHISPTKHCYGFSLILKTSTDSTKVGIQRNSYSIQRNSSHGVWSQLRDLHLEIGSHIYLSKFLVLPLVHAWSPCHNAFELDIIY